MLGGFSFSTPMVGKSHAASASSLADPGSSPATGRPFVYLGGNGALSQPSSQSRSKRAQPHPRATDVQTLRQLIPTAKLPGALLAESLALWLPTNRLGPLKQPGLRTVIAQDAALAKLCQPLDDTTVLVLPSNLKRFRNRLEELGYLLG